MSSEHNVTASWAYAPNASKPSTYSRNLNIDYGHGAGLKVSAAAAYFGDALLPDPEQLFLSAVVSCHMLSFLAIAEMHGCKVKAYRDEASAYLEKDQGPLASVKRIVLRPAVEFSPDGKVPDAALLAKLHDKSHDICFVARSIKTTVIVEPVM
ncbi:MULTISPECIES: OsmC family protein [Mesorhizobium]|uniref:OsmC family peroxiredoxin n=1 Tax=Mesorhizobium denitrificans TaxID=2294114 RepID=A0A371XEE3_9HYPH|nr:MULTISPECIES: OsmC family protein [Mesorhizobium]RFC67605.1 OsmC family peroxiredoxin [Mesorhizobium denitrificans]